MTVEVDVEVRSRTGPWEITNNAKPSPEWVSRLGDIHGDRDEVRLRTDGRPHRPEMLVSGPPYDGGGKCRCCCRPEPEMKRRPEDWELEFALMTRWSSAGLVSRAPPRVLTRFLLPQVVEAVRPPTFYVFG